MENNGQTGHNLKEGVKHSHKLSDDSLIAPLQAAILILVVADQLLNYATRSYSGWLLLLLSLMTIVLISVPLLTRKFTVESISINLLFHLLLGIFIVFIAPYGSYYDLLLLLVVYGATYWYGDRGFFASYAYIVLVITTSYLYQSPDMSAASVIVKVLMIGVIGGLMNRMHAIDYNRYKQLSKISSDANYERERLRSLINSMGDAVIATDFSGRVLVYNGATLSLLNTNENIYNKYLDQYINIQDTDGKKIDLIKLAQMSNRIVKRSDLTLRDKDGQGVNIYVSIAQIHPSYGVDTEKGLIIVLRDITKEKSIEEQRDEFISVISHELRTPVSIAEANISTSMLPNVQRDKKKAHDLLEQAHSSIVFLANLISDITALSHAERGDMKTSIEDVDPKALVADLSRTFTGHAVEKKLDLMTSISDQTPNIRSNAYRLNEILHNFVTNSIKYTERGSVTIGVEPYGQNFIRFWVEDTGIGMAKSDQRHIFEKFWRSEDLSTRAHNGTGLGLYISKKLAERMHCEIEFTSSLGKGSKFSLIVPLDLKKVA